METFVVTLLAVALVGKEIQSAADVKVTDAAGVGEVETFVERIAYTAERLLRNKGFTGYLSSFQKDLSLYW